MKITVAFKKIIIALVIAFSAVNLGIGIANGAMQQIKDYYHGNSLEQTIVTMNTSFGNKVISSKIIYDAVESINSQADVVVGPYFLSEFSDTSGISIEAYFVSEKFKAIPKMKVGSYFKKSDYEYGGKIVVGDSFAQKNGVLNGIDNLLIRENIFNINGIAFSNYERERINNSIFFPLRDIERIIKEPYISKEPFYLEIIINSKNSNEYAENFITKVNELKGDIDLSMDLKSHTEDYKESINPSAYIIIGFSMFLLCLSIINLILLSVVLVEENYTNFAIMKSLGAYESFIAKDFIKKLIFIIVSSAIIGYFIFLVISESLNCYLGIGIYNGYLNFVITVGLSVLSALISMINPYFKIKNLKLIEYLR